jgi:hypothetical protein
MLLDYKSNGQVNDSYHYIIEKLDRGGGTGSHIEIWRRHGTHHSNRIVAGAQALGGGGPQFCESCSTDSGLRGALLLAQLHSVVNHSGEWLCPYSGDISRAIFY